MSRSMFREEKLAHARRLIERGDISNRKIREALTAIYGSAISPSELAGIKRETYAKMRSQPAREMPGTPIVLNADGTWQYLKIAGKGPAT